MTSRTNRPPDIPELRLALTRAADEQRSAERSHKDNATTRAPFERSRRRTLAFGTAVAAAAMSIAGAITVLALNSTQPAGAATIVDGPPVPVRMISQALTKDARVKGALRNARSIALPGGRGFLFIGPSGWCLSQPDPESNHPETEYGLGCVSTNVADQRGISQAMIGKHRAYYVAVIPKTVHPPVAVAADGTRTALQTRNGVVRAEFAERVTLYEYDRAGGESEHIIQPQSTLTPGGVSKGRK
jgi:hypothetical protein